MWTDIREDYMKDVREYKKAKEAKDYRRHRHRGWVWTWQLGKGNIAVEDYANTAVYLRKAFQDGWCMWRPEKAPKTGQIHLQGCVYWKEPKSFQTMRKIGLHYCAPMKGTIEENVAYINKSETGYGETYEHGERPISDGKPGKRTDLDKVKSKS